LWGTLTAQLPPGPGIACSAILRYGTEALKKAILPDVFMGRKMIALGVTEPAAGSDVSGWVDAAQLRGLTRVRVRRLSTVMRDGPSPDTVLISGTKKFITNGGYRLPLSPAPNSCLPWRLGSTGTYADYVTLLAKDETKGNKGMSIVVVPTDAPGFAVRAVSPPCAHAPPAHRPARC
jgi:alkylation response protein AidB-like acyl-CoA dehydrogenase